MSAREQNHETAVKNTYNKLAHNYEHRWHDYVWTTLRYLSGRVDFKGTEAVLDVGCGTGVLEELLLKRWPGLSITGVDISEEMLTVAGEKQKLSPSLAFLQANASDLPFESERFDTVVCANCFHYFDQPGQTLVEMKRVLKKGGRLVLLDWCRDYLVCRICDVVLKMLDPAHKECYSLAQAEKLFTESGMKVSEKAKFRFGLIWGLMVLESIQ